MIEHLETILCIFYYQQRQVINKIYQQQKMQYQRSSKSQKITINKQQPEERQESIKKMNKNLVTISSNRNQVISPSQNKVKVPQKINKQQKNEEKSMMTEEIRIKGQEKLFYIKQCLYKKVKKEEIFKKYPFSNMQAFVFNDEIFRDEDGNLKAKIIQDEHGIHLVQQYKEKISNPKYDKTSLEAQNNLFNGFAVSLFHNGNIFQGTYHDGRFCGKGLQVNVNGNIYIGQFKDDVKQGEGSYYWFSNSNNEMYSGHWHGGLPHGFGVYLGKDKYQGNFSNGLKYGFGEEQFFNGDRYVGQYINSVSQGYGQYYWNDDSFYEGDFKQGVRHGFGIWQDEKEMYQGNYRLDQKEGFGVYLWKGKKIYKGQFRNDFRQGYGQYYNINKQGKDVLIYKGCWLKGKKHEQGKLDEHKVKQLYLFLDQRAKLQQFIQSQSNINTIQKKKRIGHRNCIPENDYTPHHHHK